MGGVLSFGLSDSSSTSIQEAEAGITQRYQGTCNIRCDNAISDVNLILIGAEVRGDVAITQECTLDGQCLFNNSMGAISDVAFAATNSSNAKNAAQGILSINLDFSRAESRQFVNQNINQAIANACELTSSNTMNNVTLFAANTNIGGNVLFTQAGNTKGTCTFESLMNAAAYASATATNTAESGKDKKGGPLETIASVVAVVVLLVVFGVVASRFAGPKCPSGAKKEKCTPGARKNGRVCGADGYFPCKPAAKSAEKPQEAKPTRLAAQPAKPAKTPKLIKKGVPAIIEE